MRWLLLIPVMLLFLSHIPVTRNMDLLQEAANGQENGCSNYSPNNKKAGENHCRRTQKNGAFTAAQQCQESVKGVCLKNNVPRSKETESPMHDCGENTASCICICFFQYTAPEPLTDALAISAPEIHKQHTGYLTRRWQNPPAAAPWQPPDRV